SYDFKIGKANTVVEGTDVTVAATGLLVQEAMEAAKMLKEEGISVRVLNFGTIKPLDGEILKKASAETKFIVTAEEHSIIGGLGGAVAEYVSENCPTKVIRMGVMDRFGESGKGEEMLEKFNLTAKDIAKKIKDNM
ncbi:MAG: transketolase family protein, partial [Fusobacteriaceae bacterium]|nr:transketolase family protein [Fusobacteriaceae bacterium]